MTDLRIKKSTRALLDASFQILLTNPHASLSEIASQAGVGRATLYRHYPSREHLIAAIAVESLVLLKQQMQPIVDSNQQGIEAVQTLVDSLLPFADRFHFLQMVWTTVDMDQEVWGLYQELMAMIRGWVLQGQEQGEIKANLSVVWIVSMLDSMMYSASWLIAHGQMTEQEVRRQFMTTLIRGIAV